MFASEARPLGAAGGGRIPELLGPSRSLNRPLNRYICHARPGNWIRYFGFEAPLPLGVMRCVTALQEQPQR